jgi:hypothetical protein
MLNQLRFCRLPTRAPCYCLLLLLLPTATATAYCYCYCLLLLPTARRPQGPPLLPSRSRFARPGRPPGDCLLPTELSRGSVPRTGHEVSSR